MGDCAWIAVDWGTSRLRAWAIDDHGNVVGERDSGAGMGRLKPDEFEPNLLSLIGDWQTDQSPLHVLACGMVGARTGWIEADYLPTPANVRDLAAKAVSAPVSEPNVRVKILPGLKMVQDGPADIMRGEETQLCGFAGLAGNNNALVCLPGTHSKWAHLDGPVIQSFRTFMTGELFELLTHNGLLAQSTRSDGWDDDGFAAGVVEGLSDPAGTTANLFKVRVSDVLANRRADWCKAWLSGLLIGSEISVAASWAGVGDQGIHLIGAERLSKLYEQASSLACIETTTISGSDTVLAGLKLAWSDIHWETP